MSNIDLYNCNQCDLSYGLSSHMPYKIDNLTGEKIPMVVPCDATQADGFSDEKLCLNCRHAVKIYRPKEEISDQTCPQCNKKDFLEVGAKCPKCQKGEIVEDEMRVWF